MGRPRTRAGEDVALPTPAPDGEIYLTAFRAARVIGTTPRTIQRWRASGLVEDVGRVPDGRQAFVYRLSDLTALDARLRSAA